MISIPAPPLPLAVLSRTTVSRDSSPISIPEPRVPLALFASTTVPVASPTTMPPALPLKSLPLTSVLVASSTETPGPAGADRVVVDDCVAVARDQDAALTAPDRVPLDQVVTGGQQVVAGHDPDAAVVLEDVVGHGVVAAAEHGHAARGALTDLVALDQVLARELEHDRALAEVRGEGVAADHGVSGARVERDADLVGDDRVVADRVAVGALVGVRERDPSLVVPLDPQRVHGVARGAGVELDAVEELGHEAVGDSDVVVPVVEDAGVEPEPVDDVAVEVDRDAGRTHDEAVAATVDQVVGQARALHQDLATGDLGGDRRRSDRPGVHLGVEVARGVGGAHPELVVAGSQAEVRLR